MLVAALLAGPAAGHAIAASATSAPGTAATPWTPDVRAATSFAQRSGRVAFAVRTPTRAWQRGGDGRFLAASVVKAMLMVAYLSRTDVRHRPLKRSERDLLSRMVRRSQNPPATLSDVVGADGLQRLARRAECGTSSRSWASGAAAASRRRTRRASFSASTACCPAGTAFTRWCC